MRHGIIWGALLLAGLAAAEPAVGQAVPVAADNGAIYESGFFVQFQPNTAQDMVSRLPGFVLQGGDNNERGFGQANLNILINGRRPSSKSSDASDILGRIPADKVQRIEILDGASLDIPGLSGQVANIVTLSASLSGNWSYSAGFEERTEPQFLEGDISVSGTSGNLEYVASFKSDMFTFSELGDEQFFDNSGLLLQDRREDAGFEQTRPSIDVNLTHTPANGHIANLNLFGGLRNRNFRAIEDFQAIAEFQNTGQSIFDSGEDEYEYEIGGDYAFPVGKGTLKLIGLHRYENSDFNTGFEQHVIGEDLFRQDFNTLDKEGEFIARGEYSWKSNAAQDWQLSLEGAFNYLDSHTEFSATGIDLITDNVRVEEQRAEGNLTHSWKLSDKLNLQTSLGAEYSQLQVVTGTDPAGKFFRPKGFLSASYDANSRYTWRAKVERDVGQLNFGDFRDSRSLTDNIVNAGNKGIVPTQFWNGEIELERKDDKVLSGTVKLFARYIEDPVDRILFEDGSEGPGNLDSAWLYGIEGNATWLLDNYGLKGMRMELDGGIRESSIDDPVTLVSRRLNNTMVWNYNFSLEQDIPDTNWAWEIYFEHFRQSPFFRLDQSSEGKFDLPFTSYSLTHKDILGMKMTLQLQNVPAWALDRERLIYAGDRNGALERREFVSRKRGARISLTISDTF